MQSCARLTMLTVTFYNWLTTLKRGSAQICLPLVWPVVFSKPVGSEDDNTTRSQREFTRLPVSAGRLYSVQFVPGALYPTHFPVSVVPPLQLTAVLRPVTQCPADNNGRLRCFESQNMHNYVVFLYCCSFFSSWHNTVLNTAQRDIDTGYLHLSGIVLLGQPNRSSQISKKTQGLENDLELVHIGRSASLCTSYHIVVRVTVCHCEVATWCWLFWPTYLTDHPHQRPACKTLPLGSVLSDVFWEDTPPKR